METAVFFVNPCLYECVDSKDQCKSEGKEKLYLWVNTEDAKTLNSHKSTALHVPCLF